MGNKNPVQNPSSNSNQTIHIISADPREENIVVVTRGSDAIREDQDANHGQLQVRPTTKNKVPFHFHKEKKVFFNVRMEFVDTNQASTYGQVREIPERFDQILKKKPTRKVSKLKYFFKSCLALILNKDVVSELRILIEENTEVLQPKRRVNHVGKRLNTGREL